MSRPKHQPFTWITISFILAGLSGASCGGHDNSNSNPPPLAPIAQGGLGGQHVIPSRPCQAAEEGCVCTEIGVEETCLIYRNTDDYVSCYQGTITCLEDGIYGACEGAVLTDLPVPEVL